MEKNEMKFKIPLHYLSVLERDIEDLNKKAEKLGCDNVELTVIRKFYENSNINMNEILAFAEVKVSGSAPKFSDWEWVGAIFTDHLTKAVTVRRPKLCKYVDLTNFTLTPTRCDHCGFNRDRKSTYIVMNEKTGELKQVGSTCVKDFTGHKSPEAVAAYYESLAEIYDTSFDELEKYFTCGSGPRFYSNAENFIAAAVRDIRTRGYHKSDDNASTKLVAFKMSKTLSFTDKEKAFAKKALEWAADSHIKEPNDFTFNLSSVAKGALESGVIEIRNLGIAAYIPCCYIRSIESVKKDFQVPGQPGEKIEFLARLLYTKNIDSFYGMKTEHVMVGEDGRRYIWTTSDEKMTNNIDYTVVATIKNNFETKNYHFTVVKRAKLKEKVK